MSPSPARSGHGGAGKEKTLVTVLLNERADGSRFWNLLRLQPVQCGGETFVVGVQTPLD